MKKVTAINLASGFIAVIFLCCVVILHNFTRRKILIISDLHNAAKIPLIGSVTLFTDFWKMKKFKKIIENYGNMCYNVYGKMQFTFDLIAYVFLNVYYAFA